MAAIYTQQVLHNADDIRLLILDETSTTSDTLRCRLKTVGRHSEDYVALSYVWSGTNKDQTVDCNGIPLNVTASLSEALRYLSRAQCGPLWTDAICLNQGDGVEKKRQVPRMAEIYGDARSVIIWLGAPTVESDSVFDRIPYFQGELRRMTEAHSNGFPDEEDAFWHHLGELVRRPWFSRVWTVQEAVLAKHKTLMCGDRTIEWDIFEDLINLTSLGRCRQAIFRDTPRDFTRPNAIRAVNETRVFAQLAASPRRSASFLNLLDVLRSRECSVDHDRVYGVLGMINSDLRADIARHPDLIDYQRLLHEVLVELAQTYFLNREAGQLLLSIASATRRPADLPSWCPTLTARHLYSRHMSVVPSYRASGGNEALRITIGTLYGSILVQGTAINIVRAAGEPYIVGGEGRLGRNDTEVLIRWEQSCQTVASTTASNPDSDLRAYVRTLTGNVLSDGSAHHEDFTGPYLFWRSNVERIATGITEIPPPARDYAFYRAIRPNSIGRRMFATESGRIGMGPRHLKIGDHICILRGGSCPWVLRKSSTRQVPAESQHGHSPESARYRLIGEAYVDGIMNGEASTWQAWNTLTIV